LVKNKDLLVQRLINKDKEAFGQVYQLYFGPLVNYAYRFIETKEESEEIVQDTFLKFWDKCSTLTPDSTIKSYLYRAVHNACLNSLKHDKVKDNYKEYVINWMEKSEDPFADHEQETDFMKILNEEISLLPPRCREAFELSRFEGLKYQEIADHMGISVKTVEVQIGKAFKILRDRIKRPK
jgi:RNA polymerase sigma-70 factor (ECF subfamily)